MRQLRVFLLLASFLVVAGCESPGDGASASAPPAGSGTGRPPAAGRYSTRRVGEVGTGSDFTAAEKATMSEAWKAYLAHSPGWPAVRAQWIALGPAAVDVLVDNLLRATFVAWLTNTPEEMERARRELILLGDAPVPTITGILQEPLYRNPRTGQTERLSTDMTTELVDLLKIAQAENQLMDLGRSDVPSVRRAAFDALGQLRQPDGIALLVRALGSSSDWIDRVTAAKALCYSRTPEGARALTVALRDSEDLVAIEAARSLAIRAEKSAVGELLARRDAARAADNLRLAAAFGAAAKAIEGAK